MTKSPRDIDHLSASSMKNYLECPRKWAAEYLDEVPRRWGVALVKGRAVDAVATLNWEQKRDSEADLPLEDALEFGEGEFRKTVDEAGGREGVDWGGDTFASALDSTIRLTQVHMTQHAPLYAPRETQKRVSRPLDDGRKVIGFIDAVVSDGEILDVKTGGRKMAQRDASIDLQPSAYAFAIGRPLRFTYLRAIHSGRSAAYGEIVDTRRGQDQVDGFEELARNISSLIDAGVYPTRPGFWCGYCPIANTCPMSGTDI